MKKLFSQKIHLDIPIDHIDLFPKVAMSDEFIALGKLITLPSPSEDFPSFMIQDFFGKKTCTKEWGDFESSCYIPKLVYFNGEWTQYSLSSAFDSLEEKIRKKTLPKLISTQWADLNYTTLFDSLMNALHKGTLKKCVLASRMDYIYSTPLSPWDIFTHLPQESGYPFLYQIAPNRAFIGCTPEMLFVRKNNRLFSEALAATALHPKDLFSSKNKEEFHYVQEEIQTHFKALCKTYAMSLKNPKQSAHLYHLHATFEGELKKSVNDIDIVRQFHPTSAMGGYPKDAALHWIGENETIERGFYSSCFGFCSPNYTRVMVGIRSAQIHDNRLMAYAGGGIIKTSNVNEEQEEIHQKVKMWGEIA